MEYYIVDFIIGFISHIGTIYRTFVTAAEDVSVAICHTLVGAYLAAMNVYASLSEDEALAFHIKGGNE